MAKNKIAYYGAEGDVKSKQLTTSSAVIFTPGSDGAKITGITLFTTSFGAGRVVSVYVNDGSTDQLIFQLEPTENGYIDVLDSLALPKMAGGTKYFNIPSTYTIKAQYSAGSPALTAYLIVTADNY